jgi:hypothetical protein
LFKRVEASVRISLSEGASLEIEIIAVALSLSQRGLF